jgi:hypothetical protein
LFGTQAEAVGLAGPDEPGDDLGADRRVHGDQVGGCGMVVELPGPVLLGQVWGGGMLYQPPVDVLGRLVEVVVFKPVEETVEIGRKRDEAGDVPGAKPTVCGWVELEDGGDGVQGVVSGAAGDRKFVDERDRDERPGIAVTSEDVLTSVPHTLRV